MISGRSGTPWIVTMAVLAGMAATFGPGGTGSVRQQGPVEGLQEQDEAALRAHRAEISRISMDGGVMITSNERYLSEDGGPTHYGQFFEAGPSGLDARGCLWGERDGEVLGVYWLFFTGWDVGAGQPFFYQSSPDGRVGFGHGGSDGPDGHWLDQRFRGASMPPHSRHENRWLGTDSVTTQSFSGVRQGEWTPRRSYTWVREPGRAPPC